MVVSVVLCSVVLFFLAARAGCSSKRTLLTRQAGVQKFSAEKVQRVSIDVDDGRVTVVSIMPGDKALVEFKKIIFDDAMDKLDVALDGEGTLRIFAKKNRTWYAWILDVFSNKESKKKRACKVNFDVAVPAAIPLAVAGGSMTLVVRDMAGSLAFKVGHGEISVGGPLAKISGALGSGTCLFDHVPGPIDIGAGSVECIWSECTGDVKVHAGSVQAHVVNRERIATKRIVQIDAEHGLLTLHQPKNVTVEKNIVSAPDAVTVTTDRTFIENGVSDIAVSMSVGGGSLVILKNDEQL